MHFIFDIGNVLVDFKPLPFLQKRIANPLVEDVLYRTIFQSPQWLALDQGLITQEEATAIFCR